MKPTKTTKKRGGARANSGPKVNKRKAILIFNIALEHCVSLRRAREMFAEMGERLLAPALLAAIADDIAALGVEVVLATDRADYEAQRSRFGFKP